MPEDNDLRLDSLFQINMPVRDIERAVDFYRDVLGLTLHARKGALAFFSVGSVRVLVEQVNEEGGRFGHPGSILYFRVPEIAVAHRQLLDRGVRFIEPPAVVSSNAGVETWMAFFDDGQWNTHAIASQVQVNK